jgi:aspartate/methionine/tyrosine aminotransferase
VLLDRTRTRCLANIATLEAWVAAHPGVMAWRPPAGSTVSVAGLGRPVLDRHGGDPERVFVHWREAAGVVVAPGPAFGCGPDRFRLGFGRADLPDALSALATAC